MRSGFFFAVLRSQLRTSFQSNDDALSESSIVSNVCFLSYAYAPTVKRKSTLEISYAAAEHGNVEMFEKSICHRNECNCIPSEKFFFDMKSFDVIFRDDSGKLQLISSIFFFALPEKPLSIARHILWHTHVAKMTHAQRIHEN